MSRKLANHRYAILSGHCRGFVALLILLSLLGILGVLFVTELASGSQRTARGASTSVALAKAKEALLAYAIARDDRPGEFPCPTTVVPTAATYGTSASGCATVRIGRVPWKTLGIQELFDGDGEPLWYAVSNSFRTSVATKINSDTLGDLTVFAAGGSTAVSSQVVAVIFSAGSPVANQSRTSAVSSCATTATSIAGNICAANYLDVGSGRNNATNAGPYIADRPGAAFNDQIAYITTPDFIPKIEDRIATILAKTLKKYYDDNTYYPYAASYSGFASPTTLNCANGKYVGRLPRDIDFAPASPGTLCVGLAGWPGTDYLPAWFTGEQWYVAIHYAVGSAFAIGGSKTCLMPGDCLTVGTDTAVQAVFILPGVPTATQTRPSSNPVDYLEAPANSEDWPTPVNYTYVTTTSALPSRDRVVAIKN